MRCFWVTVLCYLLLVGGAAAADKPMAKDQKAPVLKDQKAKDGYAIGYQIGEDFKRNNLPVDPDMLARGIRDALTQRKPLMTPEERRAALMDLETRVRTAQQQMLQEKAAQNLAASEKFLAENRTKEGVQTLPSGLQYRVIQEGSGPTPKPTETVTVHYRGTLIDGTEFDSSYRRGAPATLPVEGLIPGWTEALQLMKTGSKWDIFIPPQLAYGDQSPGPIIGPNSALIFEVELISINEEKGEEKPQEKKD
ncbi:MAG TPA: FKBP-type peptidyl-prolyl cis-trans isomerase [Syntrophobacteria bacterium]|nr:FKBP-type peptidyl-prolyl cis-trans isomerase [Syntrophobacteria bacterium]